MKIAGFFHGTLRGDYIILKATDDKNNLLVKKMFDSKSSREERSKQEILLKCQFDAQFQKRTVKQLGTVWTLVTVIFESMENRLPTEEEKYELYQALLEEYADKKPSSINKNKLIPVRISESNTELAARFIDGLLYHLSTQCELSYDLQAEVRTVLYEWEILRGKQELDSYDSMTVSQWRKYHVYSQASGLGGNVDCHHILSRGGFPQYSDCAWNVLALTREEHTFFHAQGWNAFLEKYPHLRGRVEKAYKRAGLGEIPNNFEEEKEYLEIF